MCTRIVYVNCQYCGRNFDYDLDDPPCPNKLFKNIYDPTLCHSYEEHFDKCKNCHGDYTKYNYRDGQILTVYDSAKYRRKPKTIPSTNRLTIRH